MELTLDKIKFKLTDEKPCRLTFSVQVPPDLVKTKRAQVTQEFQKAAHLPGFRAGKAPKDLIERNYASKITGEVLEQILRDSVPHVLKQKSITPIATPTVEKVEFDKDQALKFHLIIERNPVFTVKGYKKMALTRKAKKVSEADMDKELEQLRERNAQLAPATSEKAEKEHFAVIRYEASFQGQPVKDLSQENQLLNLSAPQAIEGFAEAVLGMAKGETREVTIPLPKEYPDKKVAGQPVQFKITLTDLKEKKMPPIDDEFAKDFEVASLAELKDRIRPALQANYDKSAQADLEKQIYDKLIEDNPIPLPETMVEMQLESLIHRAKELLARQGYRPEAIQEKEPEWRQKYRAQAERQVRLSYLLSGISKQESLQASREEWQAELDKSLQRNPEHKKEVESYFQENQALILNQMTEEKVIRFVIENAKMKEAPE